MHGLSDFIYLPLIGCCCYSSRSSKKRKKAKKQKDQLCNNIVKHKNPVFLGGWVVRTDIERPFSLIVIRFFLLSLLFFVCYTLLRSYHQWQQHVERERERERFPSDALFRSVNSFRPANGVAESRWRLPRKDFIFFRCYLRSLDRLAEKTYLSNLFNFGSVFILYSKR